MTTAKEGGATPRCNEWWSKWRAERGLYCADKMIELARTLERELEAVLVERDAAQVERDTQRDITDRENSRAIAAESQLAEARRDVGVLREALSGLLSAYRHSAPNTVFEAEKQLDRIRAAGEQARAALQSTAESAGKKEQG